MARSASATASDLVAAWLVADWFASSDTYHLHKCRPMPRTTLNSTSPYFIGSRAFDVPETRQHGSRDRLQVNRCHGQLSSTTSAAALDGSPASPRRQSSSGLRENFLDAVAGAALEGPLLKAELAGRDSNQSHLVFAGRTRRSLTNRRCHHSHANRGWGPEQEIPDPCTDRNDSLKVRRLVSAVPTIIGKSHGALTVSNLSQLRPAIVGL